MSFSDSSGGQTSDSSMAPLAARAYLGVGSSLSPEENILRALTALSGFPGIEVTRTSNFYRTPPLPAPGASPVTVANDPDFLNGVFEIRTELSPETLTLALAEVENATGRVRAANKYAPRSLDLDLLVYLPAGRSSTEGPYPVHRDITTRSWVALPLFELAPDLLLPPHDTPLAQVASTFTDPGGTPDVLFTKRLLAALPQPNNPFFP